MYHLTEKNKNKSYIHKFIVCIVSVQLEDIKTISSHESVRVEIKTELFNTRQNIFLCIKGKPDLPIVQINRPIKINEVEQKGSILASFLNVPLKGI